MKLTLALFACAGLLGAAAFAAPETKTPAGKTIETAASLRERYKVLEERNMFLKDRSPRSSSAGRGSGGSSFPPRETTPPRPDPEKFFVVRGCTIEDKDGKYRSVQIEAIGGTGFLTLGEGDVVARGTIFKIEKEGIEYEYNGRRLWIALGNDLTGSAASTASPALSVSLPTLGGSTTQPAIGGVPATLPVAGGVIGTPAGGAATPINTANLSIEERMRLRRLQEQQK